MLDDFVSSLTWLAKNLGDTSSPERAAVFLIIYWFFLKQWYLYYYRIGRDNLLTWQKQVNRQTGTAEAPQPFSAPVGRLGGKLARCKSGSRFNPGALQCPITTGQNPPQNWLVICKKVSPVRERARERCSL